MKNIITVALAVSLFACTAVFADDGNQGNTGNTIDCKDPNNCPPAVCTEGCPGPQAQMDAINEITLFGYVEDAFIEAATGIVDYTVL